MKAVFQKTFGLLLTVALLHPAPLLACSICYGEPDSPVSRGLTWAIVALGGIVVCVLGGAVAFFVQANRKAGALQAASDATALIEKT
ncbi:MAG TPA: hypothetical protein VN673_16585 [Clostridia bacterium]|nr:hypothetical protein [Clostridia bacterium]